MNNFSVENNLAGRHLKFKLKDLIQLAIRALLFIFNVWTISIRTLGII